MSRLPSSALGILGITFLYRIAAAMAPLAILLTLSERPSMASASIALTGWTLMGANVITESVAVSPAARSGEASAALVISGLMQMLAMESGAVL
ncbi:hypothetical protein [Rhizobium aegyptiacum]|uniref:hypothetical protein n=1 Tax=Rhizobium aegyptiacum TaxID=1764550 RepID=UPI0012E980FB|nr:hypothetical protein [Rhizobium aegyptiacum]